MNLHRKLKRISFLLLFLTSILYGCQVQSQETTSQEMSSQVTVSILPQAYFIERISGGRIAVNVMVGPGEEAHTYEPKPEQMRALAESQVFFTIGLEYEAVWVPRFLDINPNLTFIDLAKGIERIPLSSDHDHHEEEENNDDEVEEGLDPHVWLSPENGRIIAKNTLDALSDLMPDSSEIFQENYDLLVADIESVDNRINDSLKNLDGRNFMVFHPAWGYFAEHYNLEQLPVQIGGQDPSASELASLIEIAQKEKIKVIFIQPSFNTASAEAIAQEIGAEVAVVDPLAQDWLSNLESAAEAFASAMNE